jgi:two-component system NarL family sensor kinase
MKDNLKTQKLRISISLKLFVFFFVFSQIAIISIGTYSYFKARSAMISRTYNQLISVRIEKENRLQSFFHESTKDLDILANFEEVKELCRHLFDSLDTDIQKRDNFIHTYFHNADIYECISFYTQQGKSISFPIAQGKENANICQTPMELFDSMYVKALIDTTVLYDKYVDSINQEPHLILGKLIHIDTNDIFMALQIPISVINHVMIDNNPLNGLGESGEAYLVGEDHLMRSSSRFKDKSILITEVNTEGVVQALKGIRGRGIFDDYRGISVLSSYSLVDLPYMKWAILAEIDFEEAMIPIIRIRNNIVYLTLLISILMLSIVALISVAFTRPIKALQKETEKIAQGEYGKPIDLESNDELGDLIQAFNLMNNQLKEQSIKLENERKLRLTSMIDGQELERQRLSRELHDSIAQHLLAIKMQLENALDAPDEQGRSIINNAIESFKLTTQEIRYISNNLRPAVLSEFGLVTALNNVLRNYKSNFQLHYTFDSEIDDKFLDARQETYLFRICQEALQNIAKYAQASKVDIKIRISNGKLVLSIKDNGLGFPLTEQNMSKGNGLSNMKERAQLLNGQFTLDSIPGEGTRIVVSLPLNSKSKIS